jgi:hypothetical protein
VTTNPVLRAIAQAATRFSLSWEVAALLPGRVLAEAWEQREREAAATAMEDEDDDVAPHPDRR